MRACTVRVVGGVAKPVAQAEVRDVVRHDAALTWLPSDTSG